MSNTIDILERIIWRGKKLELDNKYYVEEGYILNIKSSEKCKKLLSTYNFDKNNYFYLLCDKIVIKNIEKNEIKYSEIFGIEYPDNMKKSEFDHIFLIGPNYVLNIPSGEDFFKICSILLMCIRLSQSD